VRLETEGCEARLEQIGEGAAELLLAAGQLARGQAIRAIAHYQLTLKKQYLGHAADRFPVQQPLAPAEIRRHYLQDSPGIQTSAPEVRKLLTQLRGQDHSHPWDLAKRYQEWIGQNIKPQVGAFTGVINGLKRRAGDCEEMAAIFVALCRAAGIPARLVWVPNHNWAEFYLTDYQGTGHWIPAHTACYRWFGWTGAHELVIQKGDRVTPPYERRAQRLIGDWMQWMGKRPAARYIAELKPLPPESDALASPGNNDAGPGARSKQANGQWKLVGNHPSDRHMRKA
jgi:transglutaminase superfamily protein